MRFSFKKSQSLASLFLTDFGTHIDGTPKTVIGYIRGWHKPQATERFL